MCQCDGACLKGAGLDAFHRVAVGVVRSCVKQEGDVQAGPPSVLRVGVDAEIRVGRDQAKLEEVLSVRTIFRFVTLGSIVRVSSQHGQTSVRPQHACTSQSDHVFSRCNLEHNSQSLDHR